MSMRSRVPMKSSGLLTPSLTPAPFGMLQRKCACGGSSGTGQCAGCNKKGMALQRRSVGQHESKTVPPIVHEVLHSPSQPLDAQTRAFFDPRFRHDFSQVRVHTDSKAAKSASAVNALAYTVGANIVFGAKGYEPQTSRGRGLLAHELAHVVQQSQHFTLSVSSALEIGPEGDQSEIEAERAAAQYLLPTLGHSLALRRDQATTLRRAVTVPENAAELKVTADPSTSLEVRNLLGKWRAMPKTPKAIEFSGSARAQCDPGESATGYEVGIVQVETHEMNNGLYQGAVFTDGSVWIRLDTPAVRPVGPCLDSPYAKFWSDSKALSCGSAVALTFKDWPQDMYDTVLENPLTKKPNFLKEIHLAFEFITALMLKRPDARLQTLRWARWHVGWDYSFDTPTNGESKIRSGSIAKAGTVQFAVSMPAPTELPGRYAVPSKNCNTIGNDASNNPARIQASSTW